MKHLLPIACILWLAVCHTTVSKCNVPSHTAALHQFPLKFTQNKGQIRNEKGKARTDILFTGEARGINFYLTKQGIIYRWNRNHKGKSVLQQVHMELIGANADVVVQAEEPVPGVNNYFHSAYPQGITQVQSFQRIVYQEVYPNIDFVIYSNGADLKYDFIVKPGGNPSHIRFSYKGNQQVRLKKNGSLLITNPMGKLIEGKPFTYQQQQGDTTKVHSAFRLQNGIVSFRIGLYDTAKPVVIDPAVSWATYYGGEKDEHTAYIKTDAQNNLYVTGLTESKTDILNSNVFSGSFSRQKVGYLLKFNKDHQLQWATYFADGGSANDLITDDTGNLYICGDISPEDLSLAAYTANTHQPVHGGSTDAFLIKFSPDGQPIWATYYGGTKNDKAEELAIGPDGNIYMVGNTNSENGIATTGAYRTTAYNPGCNSDSDCDQDVFIVKFNSGNGQRIWGTYFGGTHKDYSTGVASDGLASIYVCGRTISTNGIAFGDNPHQSFRAGNNHGSEISSGYLAKFSDEGQAIWGTYYGNNSYDNLLKVMTDGPDNIYIIGDTQGSDFITNSNDVSRGTHQTSRAGSSDVIVAKFNSSGKKIWATFYGGTAYESAMHIFSDKKGGIYIIGNAESNNGSNNYIATTTNIAAYGLRNDYGGGKDLFIAKLDTSGKRIWGAYYGGNQEEWAWGGALNTEGKIYIAGSTKSAIPMPAQTTRAEKKSVRDIFIAVIDDVNPSTTILSPTHESTGVPTNSTLEITFTEPIAKGTGNINIKQADKNTVIPVTDASVSISGNKAIIDASNFDSNILVEIQVSGTAFTDLAGNPFGGIAVGSWKFTTAPDLNPPQIVSKTPQNGSNTAARDTKLEIEFDEDVYAGTGSITVWINSVPISIAASSASVNIQKGKVAIILPNLAYNATVSVQIDALAFKDPAGNYFAGITPDDWQFTVKPDQEAPLITSQSPAHGQDNVPVDTDVKIIFNEPVSYDGQGISIRQNNSPVAYTNITTKGDTVHIEVPAFQLGSLIAVEISNTAFKDAAGNYFTGIAAGEWQFNTLPALNISPQNIEPIAVTHNGSAIDPTSIPNLAIQLNPNPAGTQVALHIRGLSEEESAWQKYNIDSVQNTYSISAPTEHIDAIGLEYYFEITPPAGYGGSFRSNTGIVYINYEQGLEIPMVKGDQTNQYQLVSIPLDLQEKSISQVFNHLGPPDIEKWRLYRYTNDGNSADYQEYTGTSAEFTRIETGRAYWILARDGAPFMSGAGSTVKVRQAAPYVISLKPGWNLIGNPYDMEVVWADVQSANATNAPDLGELNIFNGGYESGDLKKYSGGFVWADQAVDIKIPALRNKNGGRRSAVQTLHHKNSTFEVNFTVQNNNMHYRLGGLGMHPEASSGKDRYDRYLLPRFTDYLEIRFDSPEVNTSFTKQMVPAAENYSWEFTIETNQATELTELWWENYIPEPDGRQLFLYDVQQEIVVDMLGQNVYKFTPATSSRFKVFYSSSLYISKHLRPQRIKLNQNVPNPFRGETLIPFSLPDDKSEYTVEASIYNTAGVEVASVVTGKYQPGFHQLKWNGTDKYGHALPAGLYIARLIVAGENQSKEMFIRLIIQ